MRWVIVGGAVAVAGVLAALALAARERAAQRAETGPRLSNWQPNG